MLSVWILEPPELNLIEGISQLRGKFEMETTSLSICQVWDGI